MHKCSSVELVVMHKPWTRYCTVGTHMHACKPYSALKALHRDAVGTQVTEV